MPVPQVPASPEVRVGSGAAAPGTPQRLLAIVVDGRVLSAPEVQAPLATGDVEISGTFSRQEAEDLVRRILGPR